MKVPAALEAIGWERGSHGFVCTHPDHGDAEVPAVLERDCEGLCVAHVAMHDVVLIDRNSKLEALADAVRAFVDDSKSVSKYAVLCGAVAILDEK